MNIKFNQHLSKSEHNLQKGIQLYVPNKLATEWTWDWSGFALDKVQLTKSVCK